MSAYIVDPRTIDYLVSFGTRKRRDVRVRLSEPMIQTMTARGFDYALRGSWLSLVALGPQETGRLLLAENIRSVRARYPDDAPDNLPGPTAQSRIWAYTYRPVPDIGGAAWVVMSCNCLSYQSCETDDWKDTIAYAILDAIREAAVTVLTDGAPWGVSEADLNPKPLHA